MMPLKCKECGGELFWDGYASMGSSHSNYYKCHECKRVVEIYDREIRGRGVEKTIAVDGVEYKATIKELKF